MALTQSQKAIVTKAQMVGGSKQGVALSDGCCTFLVAVIARDLGLLDRFPEFAPCIPPFFSNQPLESLSLSGGPFLPYFERLIAEDANADTYLACLASLHKARLKFERILQTQPIPTIDQVGPRGLLQFGRVQSRALTPFLLWRKWIFDIDNRAGQETGYVFEPIIAYAIGGVPVGAKKSPIRRQGDTRKGRQVDCVVGMKAHEIKLRVTSAASGQGRWREELDFPGDCKASGYTPVLVVLDPTANEKLAQLKAKFEKEGGEAYIGEDAWGYLHSLAGQTMAKFLENYVHLPIQELLSAVPPNPDELPDLLLTMSESRFSVTIAGEKLTVARHPSDEEGEESELPDDVEDEVPGP